MESSEHGANVRLGHQKMACTQAHEKAAMGMLCDRNGAWNSRGRWLRSRQCPKQRGTLQPEKEGMVYASPHAGTAL